MFRLTAYLTLAVALSFAVSPFLVPDFGGFDADQFPVPQENPPVQPSGYAFAIWGLIYLWLILGMGFGVLRRAEDPEWHRMRFPLIFSLAIGTIWLPVAVASPVWASILIWMMLVSALVALFCAPRSDRLWSSAPLGLYAGWLSAASCVSLGLLAAGYGYTGERTAALLFIFAALVLAAGIQSQLNRTPTYGIAVIWALAAIVHQNLSTDPTVAALAAGGALAMVRSVWNAWRAETGKA